MNIKSFLLGTLLAFFYSGQSLAFDHEHKQWDAILKKNLTSKSLVSYKDIKANKGPLESYLKIIKNVKKSEYKKWNKQQKMTFLINAYNAYTVKVIIEHYPLKSIKDIGSLFTSTWKTKFPYLSLLEGSVLTLDGIEHDTLRKNFKDYRIHAAVNCASISCPVLRGEAYTAAKLDAQLDEQMKRWLADPSRNQFDSKKGTLELSKIFDWYEDDFVKWGGGIKKVLKKYGPKNAKQAIKKKADIDYMDYDWNLNDASSSPS
ncbi:MAG: DUF547 domain-containing protein [Oligoflexales bacterium]